MSLEKTEIDVEMEAFIKDAQAEFAVDSEIEAAVENKPVETPAIEQENTVVPEEKPEERGLERLVAREIELRERENRLSGTEKEMEALRARVRELEPRTLTPELIDKIKLSPSEGLRALGLDPDEVVRQALVEKLGDKVNDPETKALLERSKLRREMESLRAQVQEAQRQAAAQAYYNQISHGASEYLKNEEGLSKYPTVSGVAKSNPTRVFSEIMEEITKDANVRAAQDPTGDPISYDEAARRVEARWGEYRKLFSLENPATPASTPAPGNSAQAKAPAKTLVEAKEEVKTPPSTVRPPEKPLAPWLQRNLDEEEALRVAMAEYKRLEGIKT